MTVTGHTCSLSHRKQTILRSRGPSMGQQDRHWTHTSDLGPVHSGGKIRYGGKNWIGTVVPIFPPKPILLLPPPVFLTIYGETYVKWTILRSRGPSMGQQDRNWTHTSDLGPVHKGGKIRYGGKIRIGTVVPIFPPKPIFPPLCFSLYMAKLM